MDNASRRANIARAVTHIGLLLGVSAAITGCGGRAAEPANNSAPTHKPPTPGATLFADSFDDDRNGWTLPENEIAKSYVAGGDLVLEAKKPDNLRPHLLPTPLGDASDNGTLRMRNVVVRASFTQERGKGAAGVFCREVHDADSDFQWYEFVVRDGFAAIRRADSAGHLDVLAATKNVHLPVGKRATIEASCIDTADRRAELSLNLNDRLVLQAHHAPPLGQRRPWTAGVRLPGEGRGITLPDPLARVHGARPSQVISVEHTHPKQDKP